MTISDLPRRAAATIALFAVLAYCAAATAQDDPAVGTVSDRTESFFDNLQQDEVDAKSAFGALLVDGPLADPARDTEVAKIVEQYEMLAEKYGALVSTERISAKRVGNDLIFLKYLYKAKNYPVVWYFTFYHPNATDRPEDGWKVIAVRFDTRLNLLELTN